MMKIIKHIVLIFGLMLTITTQISAKSLSTNQTHGLNQSKTNNKCTITSYSVEAPIQVTTGEKFIIQGNFTTNIPADLYHSQIFINEEAVFTRLLPYNSFAYKHTFKGGHNKTHKLTVKMSAKTSNNDNCGTKIVTRTIDYVVSEEQPTILDLVTKDLVGRLNIKPEEINLIEKKEVVWPNSCLGLEDYNHSPRCADVLTPGYKIILEYNNQNYLYHTDKESRFIYVGNVDEEKQTKILDLVIEHLANRLNVKPEEINLIEKKGVVWPNSCLGQSNPRLYCLQVLTPGYKIILEYNNQNYLYHTDKDSRFVYRGIYPPLFKDQQIKPEPLIK